MSLQYIQLLLCPRWLMLHFITEDSVTSFPPLDLKQQAFSFVYVPVKWNQYKSLRSTESFINFTKIPIFPIFNLHWIPWYSSQVTVSPGGPGGNVWAAVGCSRSVQPVEGERLCPTGTSAAFSGCGCTGASASPAPPPGSAVGPPAAPPPASALWAEPASG